jgi:hypothetical protein
MQRLQQSYCDLHDVNKAAEHATSLIRVLFRFPDRFRLLYNE